MTSISAEEILNDPVALAIAVLLNRIRGLAKEDRDDFFELTQALASAKTDEEYEAAARALREILNQKDGGVHVFKLGEPPSDMQQEFMDHVGGRIRHFREAAGLTQEELAEKSGLPQSHISRLETGRHSPSWLTLEKIAKPLGINPSELASSG